MMERMLITTDVTIKFGNKVVLDHISANFRSGIMTAVIGSNGVGKTTYLKAISKMLHAQGKIVLSEHGTEHFDRKEIAYVPQLSVLQTKLTAFEMVLLGLVNNLKWHVRDDQIERVYQTLEELGIADIAQQPFVSLSGGQKQLVSMAQSLISKPKVLLLDEPTSALDLRHQLIVMNLAKKYTEEQNAVTIFVVHDLMLASRYGADMLVLHKGQVWAHDQAEKILTPELIKEVYGVSSKLISVEEGYQMVLPISPLEQEAEHEFT